MRRSRVGGLAKGLLPVAALALAGCNSAGSGGNTFSNLLYYGGTTVPPVSAAASIEVPDCPPVDVTDGGAALRNLAGRSAEAGAVRSQISIANVARECTGRPDGSIVVKVGVQGRALAGPGGAVSRTEVPVYFVLKRGDNVLASKSRRVPISVEPDGAQGSFVVVEDNLIVPPGIGGEFEIEAGLGTGPTRSATAKPRRGRG